jgi:hypothetical protein
MEPKLHIKQEIKLQDTHFGMEPTIHQEQHSQAPQRLLMDFHLSFTLVEQ